MMGQKYRSDIESIWY